MREMVKKIRKGITPVIAIVLLLMITVGVAGAAYVWIKQVQEQTQAGIETGIIEQTAAMQARLSIDSIWENTNNDISFMLRNSGSYTYTSGNTDGFKYYMDDTPVSGSCGMRAPGTTCSVDSVTDFPSTGTFTIKAVDNFGNEVIKSCVVSGDGCE